MKYKKAITALALAALLLAGCAAPQAVQAPAPQQTAKAAETQSGVTFTDAMGYPVTVQSWNRVVSLYGSFAEAWTLAGGPAGAFLPIFVPGGNVHGVVTIPGQFPAM